MTAAQHLSCTTAAETTSSLATVEDALLFFSAVTLTHCRVICPRRRLLQKVAPQREIKVGRMFVDVAPAPSKEDLKRNSFTGSQLVLLRLLALTSSLT